MSQAVIEFCEGLKTTLLAVEEGLAKAKATLESEVGEAAEEAKKHINEAAEQLATFQAHAGVMAEAVRADFPKQTAFAREKLKEFGQEAQVALRHAAVFLAEAAAKGAETTADALKVGARSAQRVAENLRHETAVAVVDPEPPASAS
jgi:hypothetical protein